MLDKIIKTISGTTGGEIQIDPENKVIQVAISGRSTGLVTVKAVSYGSDLIEDFSPPVVIDLTSGDRTEIIEGYSLQSLEFSSNSGDDYQVTITQWPTN